MLTTGANKCSIVLEYALAILSIYSLYIELYIVLPLRDLYKIEAAIIYYLNPYPPYPPYSPYL